MFNFHCLGPNKERADFNVHALLPSDIGEVEFSCDNDTFAIQLLSKARCDAVGHFTILSGCKALHLEQWLEYLHESTKIQKISMTYYSDEEWQLKQKRLVMDDSELQETKLAIFDLLYKVGGFDKLKIARFLKNRHNLSLLATRYDKADLERYKQLNQLQTLLNKILRG